MSDTPTTFSDWFNDPRTQSLSNQIRRLQDRYIASESRANVLQDKLNAASDTETLLRGHLTDADLIIDDTEKKLNRAITLADLFRDLCVVRAETIDKLQSTIEVNEKFIDLLGGRLKVRLEQLERVRQAANYDAGLDP
jgi:hypothetical protein